MAITSLVRSVSHVLATARRVPIQAVVIRARKDYGEHFVANCVLKGVKTVNVINITAIARVHRATIQRHANIYATLTV